MNANELADELDNWYSHSNENLWNEAAAMLRQQHKELEHMWMANTVLKVEVETLKAKTLTDEGYEVVFDGENYTTKLVEPQLKTLTDEEILTAIKEFAGEVMPYKEYENTYSDGWLDACNEIYSAVFAILKKAQEK